MNLYAYVGNDPVNFTDPTGLSAGYQDEFEDDCVDECGDQVVTVVGHRVRIPNAVMVLINAVTQVSRGEQPVGDRGPATEEQADDQSESEQEVEALCRFLLENAGSTPAELVLSFTGGLIGNRFGEASGRMVDRLMRDTPAIGAIVNRGRSAAIGVRAGRIGGIIGAAAGAVAGMALQRQIEAAINRICRRG